jgi:hypothetical protein
MLMTKNYGGAMGLEVGTVVAFYARLVNGSESPWHKAGQALVLAGEVRPTFSAEASHVEAAWDARSGRVEAHERVEFGVVVDGRVVRVAQTGLTGRVINAMRAAAPIVRGNLIGGAPRLAAFRWPSC